MVCQIRHEKVKVTVPHKRLDISFMAHQITIVVVVIAVKNKKAGKLADGLD